MHPRILAIVQAGGKGSRMDVLTRECPKPALPFAGTQRLIDYPLSNLHYSGISDVWLSVQYLGQQLGDYVGNGSAWDLDRHHGGFRLLMPEEGSGGGVHEGFSSGNAEELFSRRDAIRRFGADAVLVLSADHVYRLDYTEAIEEHLERGADCTIVTTRVGLEDAGHHAVVEADADGRVTGFDYKPETPSSGTVATEVFVYSPDALVDTLEELHRAATSRPDPDPDGLGDFGETLIPALVERGNVFAHELTGYWRDVGRPDAYMAAHRELLSGDADLLDDPATPLLSNQVHTQPAQLRAGSRVEESLIGTGCSIEGSVRRSVLGPQVRVAPGAQVRDSVIFADVTIEAGARVDWAVIDSGTVIGKDAKVGAANPSGSCDPDLLTLVGRDCRIDSEVPRGGRLEPGTTV